MILYSIIGSFINKKILTNFFVIFFILSLIVFGNQFFIVLSQSLDKGLFGNEIYSLIFLKFIRDAPFLISFSLILSIVFTFNKLYKSSEAIILHSAGKGALDFFKIIFPIVITTTVLISFLIGYIVPSVKLEIYNITDRAKSRPDYIFFQEGLFQSFQNNEITMFISEIDNVKEADNQVLKNIFIYSNENKRIIIAKTGSKSVSLNGDVHLDLFDGSIYQQLRDSNNISSVTNFEKYFIKIFSLDSSERIFSSSSEMKDFISLFSDSNNEDLGEITYRISFSIATFILSLLSVFFSKTNNRSRINFSVGYLVIFFISYYNMVIIAKSSLGNGATSFLSSLVMPHLFFILLIFYYFYLNNIFFKKTN